jgi:hypothetical protein
MQAIFQECDYITTLAGETPAVHNADGTSAVHSMLGYFG